MAGGLSDRGLTADSPGTVSRRSAQLRVAAQLPGGIPRTLRTGGNLRSPGNRERDGHKQSRFFPEELTGFQDALTGYEYDLVALAPSTGVRLMRHGQYPPPRGACLSLGDRRYLYTTGYVPSLGRYPHGHIPTPVQITDHVGDSSAQALLAEVLLMTKMNWNSARFAEKLPVTVRFADEVGTILRDLPDDYTPEARYAFYM